MSPQDFYDRRQSTPRQREVFQRMSERQQRDYLARRSDLETTTAEARISMPTKVAMKVAGVVLAVLVGTAGAGYGTKHLLNEAKGEDSTPTQATIAAIHQNQENFDKTLTALAAEIRVQQGHQEDVVRRLDWLEDSQKESNRLAAENNRIMRMVLERLPNEYPRR